MWQADPYESYIITGNYDPQYKEELEYVEPEIFNSLRAGWLKPYRGLRPFENNQIINYNLPRSRLRERKQTFLLKAA